MGLSESKELITYFVSKGIDQYYKLSFDEKCEIGRAKFNELSEYEKQCILIDADRKNILTPLIDNLFKEKCTPEAKDKFIEAVIEVLITGTSDHNPYFYNEITADLREEWVEQRPEEGREYGRELMRMIASYDRQRA